MYVWMSIVDEEAVRETTAGSIKHESICSLPISIPAPGGQSEGVPFAATIRCCTAKMVPIRERLCRVWTNKIPYVNREPSAS